MSAGCLACHLLVLFMEKRSNFGEKKWDPFESSAILNIMIYVTVSEDVPEYHVHCLCILTTFQAVNNYSSTFVNIRPLAKRV